MKIYTKTGDRGQTGLFSGGRVSKSSLQVSAYGDVDEINSWLGFCISVCTEAEISKDLVRIQHDLHQVGADLATPLDAKVKVDRLTRQRSEFLEQRIDHYQSELDPLTQFILPGGGALGSSLHIARTVTRRAERAVVRLGEVQQYNEEILVYLNRLSDFLFVLARVANRRSKTPEQVWRKDLT